MKVPGENEAYTTKSGKQCTLVRTLDGPADEVQRKLAAARMCRQIQFVETAMEPMNALWISDGWETPLTLTRDHTIIYNGGTAHGQWSYWESDESESGASEIMLSFHFGCDPNKVVSHKLVKVPGANGTYATRYTEGKKRYYGGHCVLVRREGSNCQVPAAACPALSAPPARTS